MINGAVANVLDYGASTTASAATNTTAFNAALAASASIYVPSGTYLVTSLVIPITGPSYIVGDGPGASTISGSGAIVAEYNNNLNRHSTIKNIHIQAAPGNTGIKVKNLGLHLENVSVDGGSVGILAENMVASQWSNVVANGTANGIAFIRAAAAEVIWLNTFINCSVYTNHVSETFGLYVFDPVSTGSFAQYNTFINFDAEYCGTGIRLISTAAMNNTFINAWSEVCIDYTIYEDLTGINTWLGYKVDNTGGSITAFGTESWRAAGWNGTDQQFFAKNIRTDFIGTIKSLGPTLLHQTGNDVNSYGEASASGVYQELITKPSGGYGKYELVASSIAFLQAFTIARANNAAAIAAGLVVGDLYRTGGDPDILCIVH